MRVGRESGASEVKKEKRSAEKTSSLNSSLVAKSSKVAFPTPQNLTTNNLFAKMSQTADLACTYAALILDDGGADVSVSEENARRRRRKRKKKAAAINRR
jgi:hypothetical protein